MKFQRAFVRVIFIKIHFQTWFSHYLLFGIKLFNWVYEFSRSKSILYSFHYWQIKSFKTSSFVTTMIKFCFLINCLMAMAQKEVHVIIKSWHINGIVKIISLTTLVAFAIFWKLWSRYDDITPNVARICTH